MSKKITDFVPQAKNPNKHSQRGMRMLEESIQRDGWIGAQSAAKNGEIFAGSARQEIAADKFSEDTEPIIVESDGSRPVLIIRTDIETADDPRARRLSAAENQIAHANYDPDGALLQEWAGEDEDIKKMFSDSEWQEVTGEKPQARDAEPAIDKAAELLEKWQVKTGDLWQIGAHRLICGDCTDAATVARVMDGEKAALLFTSPPYWTGQPYDDKPGVESVREFMRRVCAAWHTEVIRRIEIQTGHTSTTLIGEKTPLRKVLLDALWADAWFEYGWYLRHRRVWAKSGGLSTIGPMSDVIDESWEVILTFYRPGHNEGGGERVGEKWAQSGFWSDIPGEQSIDGHPCPFPVELASRCISLYSKDGDIVAEPFCGSGTSIVAAENLGRRCYASELDPKYCAVALERMSTAFPDLPITRLE